MSGYTNTSSSLSKVQISVSSNTCMETPSPNLNASQAYTKWNGFSNHRVIALHALQSANVHVKTHYHERLTVAPSNLSLLQHVPSSKVVKTAAVLNGPVPTLVAAAITTL